MDSTVFYLPVRIRPVKNEFVKMSGIKVMIMPGFLKDIVVIETHNSKRRHLCLESGSVTSSDNYVVYP
jgi:hypothetical protein